MRTGDPRWKLTFLLDIVNTKDFLWAKYLLVAEDTEIDTSELSM